MRDSADLVREAVASLISREYEGPMTKLDTFTQQYLETALWSSTDESDEYGGEPMDRNYGIEDIAPDALAQMVADCQDFQDQFWELIHSDLSRAGHDFWLTRNRHGAGFWDGDWEYPADLEPHGALAEWAGMDRIKNVGDYLTTMSRPYGECILYVGDDGMIHVY